jgi:cobalt-zinc-cadmium efflux system membrane fusion protein
MTFFRRTSVIAVGVLLFLCGAIGAWAVFASKPPESKTAAKSSSATLNKVNESDLGLITLTEKAEQHLGIQAKPMERKKVPRSRTYGGEVMVPSGKAILVAAPMQGTLRAPSGGLLQVGQRVKKGQPIISLLPLLSPESATTLAASRADLEGQAKNAETQSLAMKLALDRAQRLFQQEAGSKRGVEEAQAQYDLSVRSLEAAVSRLAILTKALGDTATGRAEPIELEAPEDGILRSLSALPGQNVPAGAALFEVINLSEVWVRVPVYVGDAREIAAAESARVGNLNMQPGEEAWTAKPIEAPPSANSLAATVDLFYALKNDESKLTPGQRVGVQLLLAGEIDSLTVPWSAVLHDLQGGTWVYEVKGPLKYCRQRVVVRYATGGDAVLADGPKPGTMIVTEGAVELFGAETGFSK